MDVLDPPDLVLVFYNTYSIYMFIFMFTKKELHILIRTLDGKMEILLMSQTEALNSMIIIT